MVCVVFMMSIKFLLTDATKCSMTSQFFTKTPNKGVVIAQDTYIHKGCLTISTFIIDIDMKSSAVQFQI